MPDTIAQRLSHVHARIAQAARRCGRDPDEIRLVAVAKKHGIEAIGEAIAAGARIIGENYIQEAQNKFTALPHQPVAWHFIGHLQTNKAKYAIRLFELIHTVDSLKLASALNSQAQKAGKVQQVLVQANISGEQTKSGVSAQDALSVIQKMSLLPHIKVKGLMTMPPYFDQPEKTRPFFVALRDLRAHIRAHQIPNIDMIELSMGMSADFEVAIEEGATLVRIGTDIFGERS